MADSNSNCELISRKVAKARGLKRYFTGTPCKHGHLAFRWTLNGACSACTNENALKWYGKNKERAYQSAILWRKNNPEKYKLSKKKHMAGWRLRHLGMLKENGKKRYEIRREHILKLSKLWAKNNPERRRSNIRRWCQINKDRRRALEHKREAKKRGNGGVHTANDIQEIFKAQQGKCAYCKSDISAGYHADHIIPLSRGGGNDRRNIQLLCRPCNLAKGPRDPIDHARSLGLLI